MKERLLSHVMMPVAMIIYWLVLLCGLDPERADNVQHKRRRPL